MAVNSPILLPRTSVVCGLVLISNFVFLKQFSNPWKYEQYTIRLSQYKSQIKQGTHEGCIILLPLAPVLSLKFVAHLSSVRSIVLNNF